MSGYVIGSLSQFRTATTSAVSILPSQFASPYKLGIPGRIVEAVVVVEAAVELVVVELKAVEVVVVVEEVTEVVVTGGSSRAMKALPCPFA